MTALAIITTPECVVVATDGGAFDPREGTLDVIAGKVTHLPEASTVITGRGPLWAFYGVREFARKATERLDFDRLLDLAPGFVERASASKPGELRLARFEYCLAGWSESRQAHEAWIVRSFAEADAVAAVPCRLPECYVSPELPQEMADVFGLRLPGSVERQWREDPVKYAALSLAALRFCPGLDQGHVVVGAFVQVTRITRHCVTSEIIQEWPDPVGQRIDPDASLWGPDGEVAADRIYGPFGKWRSSHER